MNTFCFVESLSLYSWFFIVVPYLLKKRLKICYFFDASPLTLKVASGSSKLLRVKIEKVEFRYMEIRDNKGLIAGRRIFHFDLAEIQAGVLASPLFSVFEKSSLLQGRLKTFLSKNIIDGTLHFDRDSLPRAVFIIQVVRWRLHHSKMIAGEVLLLIGKRPWSKEIGQYAKSNGITTLSILPSQTRTSLPQIFGRLLGMLGGGRLYTWYTQYRSCRSIESCSTSLGSHKCIKLAVEYYGQFNLGQPDCYSDLFFWQQSRFSSHNLLLTFGIAKDRLDNEKLSILRTYGISAVALNHHAQGSPEAPVFSPLRPLPFPAPTFIESIPAGRTLEKHWFAEQVGAYWRQRNYWKELFTYYHVRMYLTWYKYGSKHCAIADALQDLNGITAIYQRAHEEAPAPGLSTTADIVFAFSSAHKEVERLSNSVIPYHVVVGYVGDHRFALLREKAAHLRSSLTKHGAKRIVAFCDEHSLPDSRWSEGHELVQRDYAFLLNKVLTEPWFGLIIKPKAPTSIRRRLGSVAELLERAESTGRCHVYGEGAIHSIHPPALAALSADLTIHKYLYAATAGMESALAGVPTLLMDHDGWRTCSLYRLGLDSVVFSDWESLWEACCEHWRVPGGIPGFGTWTPVLDALDPFRDGRAAERMGTYLQWLIEGLEKGLDRKVVMANAAERYCEIWGSDKISSVNSNPTRQ